MSQSPDLNVAIVGGGLVGSLCACLLGNRGMSVSLFELRQDIRSLEHVPGRSINLALSERGRSALRRVGLEEKVIKKHAIPMHGRLIHARDGRCADIPYGRKGQFICSVGRRFLNETLLTAAEKNPRVKIFFSHKLVNFDLKTGDLALERPDGQRLKQRADLVIGCDGAYSAVRRQMLKLPRFNYSQTYIAHGYLELCIPATENGEFAMKPNFLHIWPRTTFMLIALPNQDRSFTVTLFMPFDMFAELDTAQKLIHFFQNQFPDAVPLIGREQLVRDFFATPPSSLVSIKCWPYHVDERALILGDAAHAMVPFYGQGMNAGFEDCEIVDDLMETFSHDLTRILPEFTKRRHIDAETICDLAMYNYIEMRHLVTSKRFLLRKKIDNFLNTLFPLSWIPLYSMVTFSKLPYSVCQRRKQNQDQVLLVAMWASLVVILAMIVSLSVYKGWFSSVLCS